MREIYWTEEAESHIWSRHQVTPQEVEQVVYTQPRWVTKGRDDTTNIFGQADEGRFLLVVLTEALVGGSYVVTARPMNEKERKAYRKNAR